MLTGFSGPRPEGVAQAKQLCEELLEKVKTDYQAFKDRPPPNRYGDRDGYSNGRPGYGDRGDRGDRDRSQSYGYGGSGQGGYGGHGGHSGYGAQEHVQSPAAAATPAADANAPAFDYNAHVQWATYYAANPEQDPYLSVGGYNAYMAPYMQAYQQYYGQAYGQTHSPAPAPGAAAVPPPPPPPEPASSYSAVPPPPGL
jgi:homoaconitase